jgi:hypothetical protein
VEKMEEAKQQISKNKFKTVALIARCGKCKKQFNGEAQLPTIIFWDDDGNCYSNLAHPHLVVNCPYCFALLNFALRITNKGRGLTNGY